MKHNNLKHFSICQKNRNKAFTLVEALVAITVVITGILSALILVTRVLYSTRIIQDRLTASFLAQEGMELVRQIRDTNFIRKLQPKGEGVNWLTNMTPSKDFYIIDANKGELKKAPSSIPYLLYDKKIGFNYTSGEVTPFQRKIRIEQVNNNQIRVTLIMTWKTKKTEFELEVEDHLFYWLGL
ncbi:MAG: hypothetical protein PHH35_02280 [Candidatus Pacebacteria bacterium]|jgi:type II secretory pathway pseudopilin PulG|nr:hypothetical protein [Candidatus Paceibacterota bacterium]